MTKTIQKIKTSSFLFIKLNCYLKAFVKKESIYKQVSNGLILMFLICCSSFMFQVKAQSPFPGTAPGTPSGSQSLSNIDNINPYTGKVNVSIPLTSVQGRGSVQLPYSVELEQNNWILEYIFLENPQGNNDYYAPIRRNGLGNDAVFSKENSHVSLKRENLKFETILCTFTETSSSIRAQKTLTLLYFVAPNGTSFELRDVAHEGEVSDTYSCSSNDGTHSNRGTVFRSRDGNAATFISDQPILDDVSVGDGNVIQPSGNLYLADGTTYRFDNGGMTTVKDRNGNLTTISSSSDGNGTTTGKYIDSLNREVTFTSPTVTQTQSYIKTIKYEGIGGVDINSYIHYGFLANSLRSGETLKSEQQLFPTLNAASDSSWNPLLVSKIVMPDNTEFKLFYNSYGDLARIDLPTGAAIEYDWQGAVIGEADNGVPPLQYYYQETTVIQRRVVERRVYEDGVNLTQKMVIGRINSRTSSNIDITVDTYGSNSNLDNRVKHFYYGNPVIPPDPSKFHAPWKDGKEYQTNIFAGDGTTLVQRSLSKFINKNVSWAINQETAPANDTRLEKQISISIEGGKALVVLTSSEFDEAGSSDPAYFSHLNIKKSKTYGYKVLNLSTAQTGDFTTIEGLFDENDIVSATETDYLYDAGYKSRYIHGLATESRILNPTNQNEILSKRQVFYDEQNKYYSMVDIGSTVGYEAPTGSHSHLRGFVTTDRTWYAEENRWIETHAQFDNFGNVRKVWDASGDSTRFIETEYSSQYYYSFPSSRTTPAPDPTGTHGTTETSTISVNYDLWTGLVLSATDTNGQTTSYEYDNLNRLKKVIPPAGGAISETEYGDTPGNIYIKNRTQVDANNWAESTTFSDNLGRPYKNQIKDLLGDIFTEVQYDSFGRLKQVSNSYRQGEQKLWSKPRYDNRGRTVETYGPAPDGQTGTSSGVVEFGISTVPGFIGNYVIATDASGRKSRSITNVYGQTVRFDEPTGNNDLGSLDNPNQPSFYSYSDKGELVKIQQGNQYRYFAYDSLGRFLRVRQPEQTPNPSLATTGNPVNNQWTAGYTYDVHGNVITVTDAKNTIITNSYDKAGRLTTTSYNDSISPQDNYYYDGVGLPSVPQFAKGNLTRTTNGVSETRYTSFDNYRGILTSQQITDGQTYNFSYEYDSVGNLTEETYPSGRVVKNHLDSDGALSAVSSKTATSSYKTYASNFDFLTNGAIKAMMLGNGRWETAEFNERHQLTQIGLGNSVTDTSLWKINYDYGELNTDGSVDTTKNIGMIAKQTITITGGEKFIQTYKYDEINRLIEVKENADTVSGTENWKQTYGYDRYGNRTAFYQKVGSNVLPINNQTLPSVDPATNRLTTSNGYTYD